MSGLTAALSAEILKARRSRLPLLTAAGFTLGPLVAGLFMLINKDPERARRLGLLGQKAQLTGGADWPALLALLSQIVAIGGLIVFAIVAAWVFGREFSDRTIRTILAQPTSRASIVIAKTILVAGWCGALSLWILGIGLAMGVLVDIPGWSLEVAGRGAATFVVAGLSATALQTTTALVASAGRGYLPPLGWAILTLVLAQIVAALGWGAWFPWAVPAISSGAAGPETALPAASWILLWATSIAGFVSTLGWWNRADHH